MSTQPNETHNLRKNCEDRTYTSPLEANGKCLLVDLSLPESLALF
jgi:hypothetical protein